MDSCVVFFHLPGPSEVSFYEITFGRRGMPSADW